MARRNSGGDSSEVSSDLRALIRELENGSNQAEAQIFELLADFENAPPSDDVDGYDGTQALDPAAVNDNTQTDLLDELASSAAAGSPYSLEVLLAAIVTYDLAGPAIGRVTQNPEQAQDIQQDILVSVARSINRFRAESKFTTWLYAVARNSAVNNARKSRATSDLGPDELLHDSDRRRMSSLVAERNVVHDAIATLPSEFRTTVILRDLEGLSYAEIAERQGIQINTVRSRLSRGRALLAERLT